MLIVTEKMKQMISKAIITSRSTDMHLKSKYNHSELHDLALNNIYIVLITQTLDIALIII